MVQPGQIDIMVGASSTDIRQSKRVTLGDIASTGFSMVTNMDIELYPNPFTDKLTIDCSSKGKTKLSIKIYNMQGKLVLIKEISEGSKHTIETSFLQTGIYFCRISSENESSVFKIIKA